jgi:integrase
VFRSKTGGALWHSSYYEKVWTPACEKAGVPRPRIHDLRHTHASWLIEQGASLEQVQDQLGHESILTTRKVYGHLQPAMRAKLQAAATAALDWTPPQQIEA